MSSESEQFERIKVEVVGDAAEGARLVAREIAELIRQRETEGKRAVLGLATGSTPLPLYRELVRLHREEGLSFKSVATFNLDEYYGLSPDHPESYHQFMRDRLFRHIDIPEEQVHVPSGEVPRDEVYAYCAEYERAIEEAGGLDYQVLGIGRTGHVGFNEPGSTRESRTRLVNLDGLTRRDAARDFLGEANVPRQAITMGVGTILAARKIVLMAWGQPKAEVVRRAVEGEPAESLPASLLQGHRDVRFLVDGGAAEALTRFRTPWLVGQVDWSEAMVRKAVIWLTGRVGKPILKLQEADYNENGLGDLLTEFGGAYNLNIKIFNSTQHTITGWPGGKPKADDSNRPERAAPFPKRVLVLSAEPHEDILCMGGAIHRLNNQGSGVILAYLTSGNLAVPDGMARDALAQMSELEGELGIEAVDDRSLGQVARSLLQEIDAKGERGEDSPALRLVKTMIRRSEARDAASRLKIGPSQLRFLDLPFYEKGRYRNFHPGREDEDRLVGLLEEIRPHQIYVSGSEEDPGSVAGVCFALFRRAMRRQEDAPWLQDCFIWSYRGVGQEWPIYEIDMAVPLSPDELSLKIDASFQYRSQRNQLAYRDSSQKEIWQQSDEINRATADAYDRVGMAEYEAIEAFRRLPTG